MKDETNPIENLNHPPLRHPCEVEGMFVSPCTTLDRAITHTTQTKAAGVRLITYTDMRTMEATRSMVVLATGDLRPDGVVMNHCPFCGVDISHHVRPAEES